ncbi:hypothetical protein ACF1A5_05340 [Streptomyces sp. NPDC014864]|uniref:hypothetical protein n=1 Tax=Streptomyces sp. NPDC014864 TaxID=3364924 RepID=UPI0037028082
MAVGGGLYGAARVLEEVPVGFSGHLVFGCSERPLLQSPVFDAMHQESKDSVHTSWPRSGGWQTLRLDNGLWEEEDLAALVAWTRAPACVADVYDSGVALLTGRAPDGQKWQACLNMEAAASLWAEEPEDMEDVSVWVSTPGFRESVERKRAELLAGVPDSARGARVWAAAAGRAGTAEQSTIEQLLCSHETFVEDLFDALLDALGFPPAAKPANESE